jgi:predicted thioesterase
MKLALPAIALALLLSGCTFSGSASLTVPASTIEKQAKGALEDQLGDAFDIDCGKDDVKLIDGTEVECVLTDDVTGEEYDIVVTISDVNGTKYHIDVDVAGNPEAEPAEEEDGPLVVDAETIAGVAAGALAPELGYDPTITCSEGVELVVDNSIRCMILDEAGTSATVLITITEVDGTKYSINAKVQ